MPEIDEPIKDFQSYFRQTHEENVSLYFESLANEAMVDEDLNSETVKEFYLLQGEVKSGSSSRNWLRFARIASITLAAAGFYTAFSFGQINPWNYLSLVGSGGLLFLVFWKLNPKIKDLSETLKTLETERDAKSSEAWGQMEPLNALHSWDAGRTLIHSTIPEMAFDSHFSVDRYSDLAANYGLTPEFTNGRSIVFPQSGDYKENPFVLTRYVQHWIGTFTYHGSMVIYWTEQVRNSNGDWVNVQRSQTLTASVVKPFPEYQSRTAVIYGHEAAPDLSFSRVPSKLSGLEATAFNSWRKENAIKKVERKARKGVKTGDSQLTVMSNREFESLFKALDRDNEVQFRLLFTPLAQQEMVNIMNDRETGYGDDFMFEKFGMANQIQASHLDTLDFDCDPKSFMSFDFQEAKNKFAAFHNDYFRSIFFGFAPLFTIPLYREKRSIAKPRNSTKSPQACYWEHEAMANFIGHEAFKHQNSVTHNLLKTTLVSQDSSVSHVKVTAYGYSGTPRVD
jgi:hypothetical protein